MSNRQYIVFNLMTAVIFTLVMTFFMTWLGGGLPPYAPGFIAVYLRGLTIGLIAAIPLSFIVSPLLQKFVRRYIK